MAKPSQSEYNKLYNAPYEKPGKSWADFADNFLFWFFEGQSFSVWIFVSGLLIVLYGKYSTFPQSATGDTLRIFSLFLLVLLISYTLYRNFIFSNPFGLADKLKQKLKLSQIYKQKRWFAEVTGIEFRKLTLPVTVTNFKKIYSKVNIVDPGDGRWRAGFVFENSEGTKEYIFHAYQDTGSTAFKSRIVEREPGRREIADKNKTLGINDPFNFELLVERKQDKLAFYIDGISAKDYKLPINDIDSIVIAAWSDRKPIKILFEDIQVEA